MWKKEWKFIFFRERKKNNGINFEQEEEGEGGGAWN